MKLDSRMQVKNVGERVGDLPALRQIGDDIQVITASQQAVKDQAVDTRRLCVKTDPGIKIGWARLDDHHQRIGIGFASAGKKREAQEGQHGHRNGQAISDQELQASNLVRTGRPGAPLRSDVRGLLHSHS